METENTKEYTIETMNTEEPDESEELEFLTEWLTLDKYYFKILTMITVLADNKKAFRGKLSDLCQSLSIQSSSANTQKMKLALFTLEENNYINMIIDNDIYTISLTKFAEKDKGIIKIKREWYKLIRAAKSSASWENILKVFLYLLGLPQGANAPVITYAEISRNINCSKSVVQRAVNTICNINFVDFKFNKEIIKEKIPNVESWKTLGTKYEQVIWFEENK